MMFITVERENTISQERMQERWEYERQLIDKLETQLLSPTENRRILKESLGRHKNIFLKLTKYLELK